MKVILQQEDKDIVSMIDRLMKISKTNLSRVCEENHLNYFPTRSALHRDEMTLQFLRDLVQLINSEARLNTEFSLSLEIDEKTIFSQKTIK